MSEEQDGMQLEAQDMDSNEETGNIDSSPEDSNQPEDIKQEAQKERMLRKLKLKVDGEEIEEEIDLNDEASLIRELQLARAAKKRMAEAQDAKRKAFELVSQFDKDPASILKRLGPKGKEIAEQMLLEELQYQSLTEEQRKMVEMENRLREYQQREQLEKERLEKEQTSQLERQQAEILQNKIIEGLKSAKAPTTPEAVKRMASIYLKNLELGLELDPSELADEYKKEVQGYLSSTFKDASIEELISIFGPDVIKKLRKYDVDQLKGKNKITQNKQVTSRPVGAPSKEKQFETTEEWLERLRKQNRQ